MSNEAVPAQDQISTARLLAQWANGWPELDPNRRYERLFKTSEGRYFLAKQGPGGRIVRILPLTLDEARQWAEEYCDAATAKRLFG